MTERELQLKSIAYRRTILRIIKQANAGHTGGSLSCIDMLNVLYNAVLNVTPETATDSNRDRYVQSKGHSVEALYTVLADCGFFPEADLTTLCRYQSPLIGHPTREVRGVEQNTGALGHGLSVGVGMALAGKYDGRAYCVYILMGDGELAEGSVWEASMTAAHYNLDNLVAIVDRNRLQITNGTEAVNRLEPLAAKFESFGYAVRSVDGHDIGALLKTFAAIPFVRGKPSLVLANTIKGKGISFIEDRVGWHHHVPTDEEYARAMVELDAAQAALVR